MKNLIALALLLSSAIMTNAQDPPVESMSPDGRELEMLAAEKLQYHLKGEEIPQYYLVRDFFLRAGNEIESENPEFYRQFLEQLALSEGSPQEAALQEAASQVQTMFFGAQPERSRSEQDAGEESGSYPTVRTMKRTSSDRSESTDLTTEEIKAKQKLEATRLAHIYVDFLSELEKQGQGTAAIIEDYIQEDIAPFLSVGSDQPFLELRPYAQAFEDVMITRSEELNSLLSGEQK